MVVGSVFEIQNIGKCLEQVGGLRRSRGFVKRLSVFPVDSQSLPGPLFKPSLRLPKASQSLSGRY